MQPAQPANVLEYASAQTERRDKLWQLAITVTIVHVAFLGLPLLLSVPAIRAQFREVQWHALTGAQRFAVGMGYVGGLHVLACLTSVAALVILRRIAKGRSAWPLLFIYVVPHLALLAVYETVILLIGGEQSITVSRTANSATLFLIHNPYLRLAHYALLSVPLLMITYLLIDHLANRRAIH